MNRSHAWALFASASMTQHHANNHAERADQLLAEFDNRFRGWGSGRQDSASGAVRSDSLNEAERNAIAVILSDLDNGDLDYSELTYSRDFIRDLAQRVYAALGIDTELMFERARGFIGHNMSPRATLKNNVRSTLAGYRRDPADSAYQRGVLAYAIQVAEDLGLEGEDLGFLKEQLRPSIRYSVDGHENADPDSPLAGDGQFGPFRIFDINAQEYLPGLFFRRDEAQIIADRLNR